MFNGTEQATTLRFSTRQLLEKIPNYPCLYRHSVNETYYAQKKIDGKRKEHSLTTTDRKIAERRLKEWINNLAEVNAEAKKMTLAALLQKFKEAHQGKAKKTRQTNDSVIKRLEETWKHGL